MWSRLSVNQSLLGPMKITCASAEGYINQDHIGLAVESCLETLLVVDCIVCVCERDRCAGSHLWLLLHQGMGCLVHCG